MLTWDAVAGAHLDRIAQEEHARRQSGDVATGITATYI